MLIISAERPELIVNYEREKADLLFLEQEDKEVHVSMGILSVKNSSVRKSAVAQRATIASAVIVKPLTYIISTFWIMSLV